MKVRGACDKPFWIYNRVNNCAAPTPDSDDVLDVKFSFLGELPL